MTALSLFDNTQMLIGIQYSAKIRVYLIFQYFINLRYQMVANFCSYSIRKKLMQNIMLRK